MGDLIRITDHLLNKERRMYPLRAPAKLELVRCAAYNFILGGPCPLMIPRGQSFCGEDHGTFADLIRRR